MVTLWPDFPHFDKFAEDERLAGIRLNSAMINNAELESALGIIANRKTLPLWYDVKGRQLRVEEVHFNENYLDITINHPIIVETPTPVLFKAGEDACLLHKIVDGRRLIFQGGPNWLVRPGESLHIRHPSLKVGKPLFTDIELKKIDQVKKAGFKKYFLSYVGSQYEVDTFQEIVGKDAEIYLKIEDKKGLDFVTRKFKKQDNIRLVAACGDLYVEVDRPHEILAALKLIIEKDPEACAGSRILLSIIKKEGTEITCNPVPSFSDFCQVAWLKDIGYKTLMLCDELCLHENLLSTAVAVFEQFRKDYAQ